MSFDDPLANELRSFTESQRIARRDEETAAAMQQAEENRLIQAAPQAFAQLQEALAERVDHLASASRGHKVEMFSVGNTITIRLDVVEANVAFNPGRPADAFGPLLPRIEFVLSRTSLTIGADVMPPGFATYKTPQRRSQELRLACISERIGWTVDDEVNSDDELADYIAKQLVRYFIENHPDKVQASLPR